MSAEETDSHHVGTNFTWDIKGRCTDIGYEKYPRRQMPHADPETSLHAGLIDLNSSNATLLYFHDGVDSLSLSLQFAYILPTMSSVSVTGAVVSNLTPVTPGD